MREAVRTLTMVLCGVVGISSCGHSGTPEETYEARYLGRPLSSLEAEFGPSNLREPASDGRWIYEFLTRRNGLVLQATVTTDGAGRIIGIDASKHHGTY